MVVAVFVVVSHVTLLLMSRVDSGACHANLFVEGDGFTLGVPLGWVLTRAGGLAFPLTGFSVVLLGVRSSAVTELPLSYVDAAVEVVAVVLVLAVVGAVLDVDLVVGVTLVGLTVAEAGSLAWIGVTFGTRQGTCTELERVKHRGPEREVRLCCLGQHTNGH